MVEDLYKLSSSSKKISLPCVVGCGRTSRPRRSSPSGTLLLSLNHDPRLGLPIPSCRNGALLTLLPENEISRFRFLVPQ